jgi:hypothetical protein
VQVRAPTLEARVSLHEAGDQEIAGGTSLRPVVTEPWKAYDLTVRNARRSLYRDRLGAAGETGAMASRAGAAVPQPFALAVRATAGDAESALAEDFRTRSLTAGAGA